MNPAAHELVVMPYEDQLRPTVKRVPDHLIRVADLMEAMSMWCQDEVLGLKSVWVG